MKAYNIMDQINEKISNWEQFSTISDNFSSNVLSLDQMGTTDVAALAEVGVFVKENNRSGTIIVRDNDPYCVQNDTEGLEMMPIATALDQYDWLRDKYYWKAVPMDIDKITTQYAGKIQPQGSFIRVRRGAKVTLPCQAAFYMTTENMTQMVHNVVIVEENAELNLITGCVTQNNVNSGLHISVDEQYIEKNGKLTSTMVHSWGSDVIVHPCSGIIVEDGGRYESNYISLRSPKSIRSYPKTWLNGKGASAKFLSIVLGSTDSMLDMGGDIYLNAEDTSAELAHRGVCIGSRMYQNGLMVGNAPCKAHVDCAGMLLDTEENGFIESVPGIRALHPDAQISHEASIGKISPEQVEYLQSRGMSEDEAISLLIRGFLDVDIEGLGTELDARINEIINLGGHGA